MNLVQFILLSWLLPLCHGFDLGLGPRYYHRGEKVDLIVNKVESDQTQLPYSYYSLPFVCPTDPTTARPVSLTLGEILRGDRKWESGYQLNFGIDMPCVRLCDLICKESVVEKADNFIRKGYVAHWEVDNLPGATTFLDNQRNKYYAAGFPLGFVKDDVSYIYNHFMIVIRMHRADHNPNLHTIVGFEVYPKSVSNEKCPGSSVDYKNFAIFSGKSSTPFEQVRIPYTYSVYWREDRTVEYESRWDMYYSTHEDSSKSKIHWFSFVNSLVLLFLVSLVVAFVLIKMLKSELESGPSLPTNVADKSWRNLYNEVLRQPRLSFALSVFTATGIQMLVCTFSVVCIFVINTKFGLDPGSKLLANNQGAFFSFSVFFLVCSGLVSSYIGIIFHKILSNNPVNQQYSVKKQVLLSVAFSGTLPSIVLSVMLFLNFFVWAKKSSNALPFGTIVVLLLFLFAIEIPLGIIGGYFGNKKKFDTNSFFITSRGEKASNVTPQRSRRLYWITDPFVSSMVFGLIPFGVVYVELKFIFNSVWLEKTTFYHMYGFLLIASIILIILIAESTIIAIYISLAVYNNPYWHWLGFNVGSSIGWYIFAYSVYYFFVVLNVREFVSVLFYFAYMGLVSVLIGAGGGAVGVISGLIFIRNIYGNVKSD